MRRVTTVTITALLVIALTALLNGCGSSKKEGAEQPIAGASRIDNANCTNTCHAASTDPVTGAGIVAEWDASVHKAKAVDCQSCHGGGSLHWGSGPIPYPNPDSSGVCSNCHSKSSPADTRPTEEHFVNLTPAIIASPVIWNNMTTAGYVTSQNSNKCRTCHNPHDPTTALKQNKEWAKSGHGDTEAQPWIHYDFKSRTPCNRCHTTTGYIKYVTTGDFQAWAPENSADKTKELLRCDGCHQDYSWKRRTLSAVKVVYTPNDGSSSQLADYGDANICMNCHSGLESGNEIVVATNIATNFSSFNSHYLAAAGLLFRKVGYLYYPATSYAINNSHIGIGGSGSGASGPCVECHMGNSASSSPDPSHKYLPVYRNATNQITSIDAASLCSTCHTGAVSQPFFISSDPTDVESILNLQSKSNEFDAAVAELKAALQNKGIYYQPDFYPYFFKDGSSNHGSSNYYTTWADKGTLGAAFNLNAIFRTPGSYAHNHRFAYELIYDSLDWLDDGKLNNSPSTTSSVFKVLGRP